MVVGERGGGGSRVEVGAQEYNRGVTDGGGDGDRDENTMGVVVTLASVVLALERGAVPRVRGGVRGTSNSSACTGTEIEVSCSSLGVSESVVEDVWLGMVVVIGTSNKPSSLIMNSSTVYILPPSMDYSLVQQPGSSSTSLSTGQPATHD